MATLATDAGGTIEHQGDAGGSIYWLCYSTRGARIWLVSSGEMGGVRHAITEFDAMTSRGTASADCPPLPVRFQPLSMHGGIWLGTFEGAVRKVLETPSQAHGSWQLFNYLIRPDLQP